MKLNLIALCSVCCALLYGNVLARDVEPKTAEQTFVRTIEEKNEATQRVFDAAKTGDLSTIRELSKDPYFSEIMIRRDDAKQTVMEVAVRNGHDKIVNMLFNWMEKNDHPNRFNVHNTKKNQTLLTIATAKNYENVVRVLLKNSAVRDACDMSLKEGNFGNTPLVIAAEKGFEDIVELLLNGKDDPDLQWRRKADPNKKDTDNRTALMMAADNGHLNIVKLLLNNEADPNIKDKDNRTALMWAAVSGHLDIVKLLLSHGAKVKIKDKKGKTALDYAKNAEISKVLTEHLESGKEKEHKNMFKKVWSKVAKKKEGGKNVGGSLKDRRLSSDSNATLYADDIDTEEDINTSVDTLVND